ncbi:tRNA (adenosine(37)-N6)-threonylcarbamoyltransferase complex ATPase subunit type 1 TsaE [Desulfuromonas versatilis]|uniref:tRNA threonylcarbamoyladenosine biosynthesis protein TsaE n=1 Tax=Desulfuromonas versatilis TaxID=2802975 RepID=A0ABN6DVD7_9BACT|nr:tRNA (adenosine(37)-N6)-threonylcarbamoyltransferase complex ATPase subunit type 1 TsaE [Desulfuromonas versatilis]BCR04100.1 tRNA (adenosine(37)-N6)-threonylcarbamoyltransferase complex ATPase subunit type 1 TsaE [Desulfuromonas versatilis]
MRELVLTTASPEETRELGRLLGSLLSGPMTLLISGDLGAGKTCFTQGFARGLDVPAEEAVASPSYTLMNQYHGRLELAHFDLYRLNHPDDLDDLGFDEVVAGDGVTVVEWADRFPDLKLPGLVLHLEYLDEQRRSIALRARGTAAEKELEKLAVQWQQKRGDK